MSLSVSSFTKKSYRLLKHRDLLACVVVCNSCKTTWFWPPENTPPSHYKVRACADVWLLCFFEVEKLFLNVLFRSQVTRRLLHRPLLVYRMPNLLCIDGIPVSSDEKTKAELYFMEQQVRGKPPASSIACVLHWSFSCVLIMSCYRMWIFPLSCCKDHVLKPLPGLFSLEWNAKHDVSFGTQSPRNRDNTFPGSASGNLIWKKNNPKTDEFCKTDFLCERIHYANWQSDSVWGVTQESIGFGLLRSAIG